MSLVRRKMPMIAIIGSCDSERPEEHAYDPPVDTETAQTAAKEIGRELAKGGFGLVVYSGGEFLERHVVEGFVAAKPKREQCIRVLSPRADEIDRFEVGDDGKRYFAPLQLEGSGHWEVSFFRSLFDCDGFVFIGGGVSTMYAGQVAIAARKPMIAVGKLGGAAQKIVATIVGGQDLPSVQDLALMKQAWTDGLGEDLVGSLKRQLRRSVLVGDSVIWPSRVATGFVLLAVLLLSVVWSRGASWSFLGMLGVFLSPGITGAGGAIVRMITGPSFTFRRMARSSIEVAAYLGAIAGLVVGVFFIAAQLGTLPDFAEDGADLKLLRLIPYLLGAGFIAGMTLDRVVKKLLQREALVEEKDEAAEGEDGD